jgi:hypothetical protein
VRLDLHLAGVDLDPAVRPRDRPHRSVENDLLTELLGHAQRDELRSADDAIREALLGSEELIGASGSCDRPETLEQRERVRGLRQESVREVGPEVLACNRVRDLGAQPFVEGDRVELPGSRMLPGLLRVELLRERVQLGVTLLERALLGGAQSVLVARVPARVTLLVDVDIVAFAVRGEQIDPELAEERVEPRLVRGDPFASELVRLATDLRVPEPTANAVSSLEHDDVTALGHELARRSQSGDTGSDDSDLRLDQAGVHASLLSAAAAAARPVRTAPSM